MNPGDGAAQGAGRNGRTKPQGTFLKSGSKRRDCFFLSNLSQIPRRSWERRFGKQKLHISILDLSKHEECACVPRVVKVWDAHSFGPPNRLSQTLIVYWLCGTGVRSSHRAQLLAVCKGGVCRLKVTCLDLTHPRGVCVKGGFERCVTKGEFVT